MPSVIFRCLPVVIFSIGALHSRAQKKDTEDYYAFDAGWKPTSLAKSKYFIGIRKVNDSSWEWDTYNFKGPIIKAETFSSHDGGLKNGPAYYYAQSGDLDSIAAFKNGLKPGEFFHMDEMGTSLFWTSKFVYDHDSLLTMTEIDRRHRLVRETIAGSDSIYKIVTDSAGETTSRYPGGKNGWRAYLKRSLHYPERGVAEFITGYVVAVFLVNEKGDIGDIYLAHSVEYSLDREVIRVLRGSGRWIPATKNGMPVKSWKTQPVSMKIEF